MNQLYHHWEYSAEEADHDWLWHSSASQGLQEVFDMGGALPPDPAPCDSTFRATMLQGTMEDSLVSAAQLPHGSKDASGQPLDWQMYYPDPYLNTSTYNYMQDDTQPVAEGFGGYQHFAAPAPPSMPASTGTFQHMQDTGPQLQHCPDTHDVNINVSPSTVYWTDAWCHHQVSKPHSPHTVPTTQQMVQHSTVLDEIGAAPFRGTPGVWTVSQESSFAPMYQQINTFDTSLEALSQHDVEFEPSALNYNLFEYTNLTNHALPQGSIDACTKYLDNVSIPLTALELEGFSAMDAPINFVPYDMSLIGWQTSHGSSGPCCDLAPGLPPTGAGQRMLNAANTLGEEINADECIYLDKNPKYKLLTQSLSLPKNTIPYIKLSNRTPVERCSFHVWRINLLPDTRCYGLLREDHEHHSTFTLKKCAHLLLDDQSKELTDVALCTEQPVYIYGTLYRASHNHPVKLEQAVSSCKRHASSMRDMSLYPIPFCPAKVSQTEDKSSTRDPNKCRSEIAVLPETCSWLATRAYPYPLEFCSDHRTKTSIVLVHTENLVTQPFFIGPNIDYQIDTAGKSVSFWAKEGQSTEYMTAQWQVSSTPLMMKVHPYTSRNHQIQLTAISSNPHTSSWPLDQLASGLPITKTIYNNVYQCPRMGCEYVALHQCGRGAVCQNHLALRRLQMCSWYRQVGKKRNSKKLGSKSTSK